MRREAVKLANIDATIVAPASFRTYEFQENPIPGGSQEDPREREEFARIRD